jgi:hypothetical protein
MAAPTYFASVVCQMCQMQNSTSQKGKRRADTEDALKGDLDFSNVVVVAIEKYPAFLKKVFDKEAHAGNGENRDHHRYDRQAYNDLLRR